MLSKLHSCMLPNYLVAVRKAAVEADFEKVVVQFHRFPGTYSTVAHASLGGVELAVATSPCIDPRNFREALGEHYSKLKILRMAEDKLWEIHGLALASKLAEAKLTEEEFYELYKDEYVFTELKSSPTYTAATLP